MKLITYYNKDGMFMAGIFGFGIRAKDTSRQIYAGDKDKVHRLGTWVYVFGSVE